MGLADLCACCRPWGGGGRPPGWVGQDWPEAGGRAQGHREQDGPARWRGGEQEAGWEGRALGGVGPWRTGRGRDAQADSQISCLHRRCFLYLIRHPASAPSGKRQGGVGQGPPPQFSGLRVSQDQATRAQELMGPLPISQVGGLRPRDPGCFFFFFFKAFQEGWKGHEALHFEAPGAVVLRLCGAQGGSYQGGEGKRPAEIQQVPGGGRGPHPDCWLFPGSPSAISWGQGSAR